MICCRGIQLGKNLALALLGLSVAFYSSSAFANVTLSVVGAGDYNLISETDSAGNATKGTIGYGGGALIAFGLAARVGFEVGGIYLHRILDVTPAGGVQTTHSEDSIYFPGEFVFGLGPGFSLLLGGFYDDFTTSGVPADEGFQGGFRFGSHSFFVDARYSQGMKDDALGKKNGDALVLVGFSFGSAH